MFKFPRTLTRIKHHPSRVDRIYISSTKRLYSQDSIPDDEDGELIIEGKGLEAMNQRKQGFQGNTRKRPKYDKFCVLPKTICNCAKRN
ncbi:tethering factor for nuclear proteasome [Acrasis kona]|uniref:Tethering factor for nuclear proteasome n=1 Tax=Acrasis kona TaxID=1008807 RepID=A0AAW2Z4Z1_9EUKA